MDLNFLETAAIISKHFVVACAIGGVVSGYIALHFAAKRNERKRLRWQFGAVAFAAFGAFAGYSVYYFTDEISMQREGELHRFKIEKDAEIASANEKISKAGAIAARANERAEELENENLKLEGTVATLQGRAAKAEKELLEVQAHLAWRDLNTEQQAKILVGLKKHSGVEFDIRVFQEPEALRFLNVMVEVLHSAGWIQRPGDGVIEISTKYGVAGVTLSGGVIVRNAKSNPELSKAANALVASLMAEGIAARSTEDEVDRTPGRIHVVIGKK
jgi:hypothetical protein